MYIYIHIYIYTCTYRRRGPEEVAVPVGIDTLYTRWWGLGLRREMKEDRIWKEGRKEGRKEGMAGREKGRKKQWNKSPMLCAYTPSQENSYAYMHACV
jgi:hypothetical protein